MTNLIDAQNHPEESEVDHSASILTSSIIPMTTSTRTTEDVEMGLLNDHPGTTTTEQQVTNSATLSTTVNASEAPDPVPHFVAIYLEHHQQQFQAGRREVQTLREEITTLRRRLAARDAHGLVSPPGTQRLPPQNQGRNNVVVPAAPAMTAQQILEAQLDKLLRRKANMDKVNKIYISLLICFCISLAVIFILPDRSTAPPQCRPDFDPTEYPSLHEVAWRMMVVVPSSLSTVRGAVILFLHCT